MAKYEGILQDVNGNVLYPKIKEIKTTAYAPSITSNASGFAVSGVGFVYRQFGDFLFITGRFQITNPGTGNGNLVISLPSGYTAPDSGTGAIGWVMTSTGSPAHCSCRCTGGTTFFIQKGAGDNPLSSLGTQYVILGAIIPLI